MSGIERSLVRVDNLVVIKENASRRDTPGDDPEMSGTRLVGPLDLTVKPGEILGLLGESGSGKTLTLRALAGINPAGLHAYDQNGPYRPVYRSAMVFQDPMGYFNPRWRVRRSVAEVLRIVRGVSRRNVRFRTEELLRDVGLAVEDGSLFPFEMSGGMIQRAAIAIALAVDPHVLLADEATSALDPTTRDRILQLLCRVGRERRAATVVVSHDVSSLAEVSDRVIILYAGQSVEEGDPRRVLAQPRHRYTDLLVRSLPGDHTRGTILPEIPPEPFATGADVTERNRGCPFTGRCPRADERCRGITPEWRGNDAHRFRCHYPVEPGEQR